MTVFKFYVSIILLILTISFDRSFHESLCILAIQAYAETDQWDRVTPFLTQYYEAVARYPVIIIKLW